ncbi:NAD(P)/FAD-dependent oxidoreductase [Pseudomonas parafulva]|uniref:NAD(P)/FAD-dependent oxidoreductase n=1 Tax=Pseudomonas parafulva TaxID=157782 RepID=UPI0004245ED7|nr:FAD-dependent oxidoreductase [Pseudomonas parafulva]
MSHSIVIIGGGAGGAELAAMLGRRSRRLNIEVTLVDRMARHFWKPRLHEVAAGLRGEGDAISYLALARANNFRFRLGSLTHLDANARIIGLDAVVNDLGKVLLPKRVLPYDTLVLAIGSQVNDFGTPGVREHCLLLDDSERALAFQKHLLEAVMLVSQGASKRLRIGIVGAGATGVELAAELCHSIRAMQDSTGLIAAEQLDITVIDMADRPLANNAPSVSKFAERTLAKMGVTLRLNSGVAQVTDEGFVLKDGETLFCDLKIWASGVIGLPLVADLDLTLDRSRRILCDEQLRCVGAQGVYAMGDCAYVFDPQHQRPLPCTAQVAHQQASYLSGLLSRKPRDAMPKPFCYRDRGSLVSFGGASTAGEVPLHKQRAWVFNGYFARLGYLMLQLMHRATLLGWRKTLTLTFADALRRTAAPPVKLH